MNYCIHPEKAVWHPRVQQMVKLCTHWVSTLSCQSEAVIPAARAPSRHLWTPSFRRLSHPVNSAECRGWQRLKFDNRILTFV